MPESHMAMCAIILKGTILADVDAAASDLADCSFMRSRNSCFSWISVKGIVCMVWIACNLVMVFMYKTPV